MSLYSILGEIKENKGKAAYTVMPIKDREGVFAGLDSDDRPCIFIACQEQRSIPSIKTAQIKVEFSKKYKLLVENTLKEEGTFHGIFCLSTDSTDKAAFIAVIDSLLKQSMTTLTIDSINSLFHSLVNLFSVKPSSDFINERRGLWAELYFMKHYRGFNFWFPSWHSEPTRIFDFSIGNKRTEVKCTTRPERIHEFNHRQLVSLPSEEIMVISFLLQEDDAGKSLKSLVEEAKSELLGNPNYIKLERAIRRVGMSDPEEEGPKFNEAHAAQQIAWFKSTEIPRFTTEEPQGVSGTHYKSDLTTANRLSSQDIDLWIGGWLDVNCHDG